MTKELTNQEKLSNFKGYVYGNKNKITYKTYVMFSHSCERILEEFLTTRDQQLILDLREHTYFLKEIHKFIKENTPTDEYLPKIVEKYNYYKDWIISESDIDVENK